ncbi:hypothetical protein [Peribacillus glennii]|uniref:Uncharacterized protein n=1 Tax=Peribacillus glennii TaxID=2303991 RepID=A0A372LEJ5_9BACI|nr:hypothetical protein [Peribacillus glennii]RFU64718.1 hypothetical protein D0466_01970 [Peribacillus glennii]
MENNTNVCYYCKKLVTFIADTCPNCDKPKKFIFEKAIQARKAEELKQKDQWNKKELTRLRKLKLSPVQWEYIKAISPTEHEMNKLGAHGWELAATHSVKLKEDEYIQEFIFKRIYKQ